jgi:hypothetical protein
MVALFAKCRTIAGENRARSSTFCKHAEEMALTGKKWLGDLDSNQDSQIQNLESYRWTISHPLRQKTIVAHLWKPLQQRLYTSNLVGIPETVNSLAIANRKSSALSGRWSCRISR